MPRHLVAHCSGAFVTLILLAVGLVIGSPIAFFAGPAGLLAAIPLVLLGVAFWVLAWMVSNMLSAGFLSLQRWLARLNGELVASDEGPESAKRLRSPLAHLFGVAVTLVLLVFGLSIGGIGIAAGGTAVGLPAAIPLVLIGIGLWWLAWLFAFKFKLLNADRRTLPPVDSERP